jgi:hypothetical protein
MPPRASLVTIVYPEEQHVQPIGYKKYEQVTVHIDSGWSASLEVLYHGKAVGGNWKAACVIPSRGPTKKRIPKYCI